MCQNAKWFNWFFPCNIGTGQGDKSSSDNFIHFINVLSTLLRQTCHSGIFISNDIPDVICLMFADDVANCAETFAQLQQQLNVIDIFYNNTGIDINLL